VSLPPGFGSNLARRGLTAVVALPLLLFALFRGPSSLFLAIVAAAIAIGFCEFMGLLRARGQRPLRLAGALLTGALFADAALPLGLGVQLWPAAALVMLALTLVSRREIEAAVPAAAGTLLAAVYLGGLGGTIAALRILQPEAAGAWRVCLLLAIIMAADTAAFFVGHAFGRHRLAPRLSPGKTVEGAIGGLLGGVAGALAVRALGLPELPLPHAVGLGVLVAALGVAGDLDESLLKRWAGVKDSGALFPGHGGMLDRLDSLLFGAPVLYYYFLSVR
jgi:phosphatidate cytidylyltransferase